MAKTVEQIYRSVIFTNGQKLLIKNTNIKYIKEKDKNNCVAFWSPDESESLKNQFFHSLKKFKRDPSEVNEKGLFYCSIETSHQNKLKINFDKIKHASTQSNQLKIADALKNQQNVKKDNVENNKRKLIHDENEFKQLYLKEKKRRMKIEKDLEKNKKLYKEMQCKHTNHASENVSLLELLRLNNFELVSKTYYKLYSFLYNI